MWRRGIADASAKLDLLRRPPPCVVPHGSAPKAPESVPGLPRAGGLGPFSELVRPPTVDTPR
eukprot:1862803-Pyramimonas_sp.AAC.1